MSKPRRDREQDVPEPKDRRAQLVAQHLAEQIRAGRAREAAFEATLDPRERCVIKTN